MAPFSPFSLFPLTTGTHWPAPSSSLGFARPCSRAGPALVILLPKETGARAPAVHSHEPSHHFTYPSSCSAMRALHKDDWRWNPTDAMDVTSRRTDFAGASGPPGDQLSPRPIPKVDHMRESLEKISARREKYLTAAAPPSSPINRPGQCRMFWSAHAYVHTLLRPTISTSKPSY